VKRTRDNQVVVFHDSTTKRLLGGNENIEELSLSELREYHYADGQSIQTLDEFFEQVGQQIRPMLEIKSRNIAKQVIDLVHKYNYGPEDIIIQSFKGKDILDCYQLDPKFDYGLCMAVLGKFPFFQKSIAKYWFEKFVKPYPVKWLNLDGPFIYDAFMDEAVRHGRRIILGAMHSEKYIEKVERWHVEIMNCDDPTYIRRIMQERGYDVGL
jgi:glycerophosphoryl diester phosphodiesterase